MRRALFPIILCFGLSAAAAQFDPALQGVRFMAYQLQGQEEPAALQALANSHYDLLVLDQTRSGKGMEDYDSAADVAALHATTGSSVNPKKVIAYLCAGEAESYRWYWRDGWTVGNPEWIAAPDPDGWDENYPVKFWREEWKTIMKEYLARIISDGFDGAYLDWLEIYSFEPVVQAAQAEGLDPERELICTIEELLDYARSLDPDFFFVAQNASEMGKHREWLTLFSGIGQEGVWFTWGGDPDSGNEQGDVPQDPELTQWYLDNLALWRAAGKVVFTIEYAEEPAHVAAAYAGGKANGFVTYVTLALLDQISATPPLDYRVWNLTAGLTGEAANPAFSPDGSWMIFSHSDGGAQNIWKIRSDGSGVQAILSDPSHDYVNMPGGSWNAVLDRICFSSDRGGNDDIWTMKPDGTDPIQITRNTGRNWEPTFSPGGNWIVFQSDRAGTWDLYKQNLTTGQTVRLTSDPAQDWEPNWSPTGNRIVFQSDRAGNWDIWIMDPDGGNLRNLTDDPAEDTDPSFSPDGRWVVYSTDRDGAGEAELYLVSTASPDRKYRMTFNSTYEGAPSISPDGKMLAFESDTSGALDLWTMPIYLPPPSEHERPVAKP